MRTKKYKTDKRNGMDPIVERKPDIRKNGTENLDEIIQRQRQREKTLFPLRINASTYIYVTKKKCTKEYAEKYRKEKIEGRK